MAVKNICTPASIGGPLTHTMYLGCSIMSFSTSMGWNEQGTSLTVTLAEDTCTGSKIYFDANLDSGVWTSADPGFLGTNNNIIGAPTYFRMNNFEYCGIIQSWEQQTGDGGETFQVQIADPRLILEDAQCIINDYAGQVGVSDIFGDTYGPYNIFNIFGYMESLGDTCTELSLDANELESEGTTTYISGDLAPDGAIFGAEAGAFGGARTTEAGTPWWIISKGFGALCNANPAFLGNAFAPFGRVVFRGSDYNSGGGGHGLIPSNLVDPYNGDFDAGHTQYLNTYFVDLTEIPVPPTDWRIQGMSMSIMDIVNRLAEDMGLDYYIELLPAEASTNLFIKVRVVDRTDSPNYGQIQTYIDSITNNVNSSNGQELRNEPTSALLIGGNKQTVYQMFDSADPEGDGDPSPNPQEDNIILPYLGLHESGATIIPYFNDGI